MSAEEHVFLQPKTDGCAHLVELPQVLLLRLVDYSQHSCDGLADNAAVMKKMPVRHVVPKADRAVRLALRFRSVT